MAVVLMWSSSFTVVKGILPHFNPLALLFARMFVITLLGVILLGFKERNFKVYPRDLPYFLLSGLFGYTFYQLGYIVGLSRTSAFSSALFSNTSPLFSLLLLAWFRLERIHGYQWIGTLISFAGVVCFLSEKMEGAHLTKAGWGDLMTLGSAFSFAIYGILNKSLVTRYSSAKIMTYTLLFGTAFLTPVCLTSVLEQDWSKISLSIWSGLVYSAVFPAYVSYSIWNWAIARQGVARTSLFALLVAPLSGILSAWFLREAFSAVKLIGFGMVLGGLVLTRLPPHTYRR